MSDNKKMVEMAASQNEAWTLAVQHFKSREPLILQHSPKMQSTLQLLKEDSREDNEKGIDEACALLGVWLEAFKHNDAISRVHCSCLDWAMTHGRAAVTNSKDESHTANLARAKKLAEVVKLNIDPEREAVVCSIGRDAKTAMEESKLAGAMSEFIKLLQTFDADKMENMYELQKAATLCAGEALPVEHKQLLEKARHMMLEQVVARMRRHKDDVGYEIESILLARESVLGLQIPGVSKCNEDHLYFNELVSSIWDCRCALNTLRGAIAEGADECDLVTILGYSNAFTQYLEHWQGCKIRKVCEREDMDNLKIIDAKMLISIQRCGDDLVHVFLDDWKTSRADIEERCKSVMVSSLDKIKKIGDFEEDHGANLWWQSAPSDSVDDLVAHGKKTVAKYTLEFLNGLRDDVTKVSE